MADRREAGTRWGAINTPNADPELVGAVDLEPDLSERHIRDLASAGERMSFQRHQYVYFQGDRAEHLYVLTSGIARATHGDANGCECLLRLHGPGSLMGIEALRPGMSRDATLVALEPIESIRLSRDELFKQVRADGHLAVAITQILAKRVSMLHHRVEGVAGQSVEQRVASALIQMHAEVAARVPRGTEPVVSISHEELATLVLSRRQYVTAILRNFVAAGLIENKRRRIQVLDLRRLRAVLSRRRGDPSARRSPG